MELLSNTILAASTDMWGSLGMFLPIIAVFGIFYFLMIRPEQKKQKEKEKKRKEMLENLKKGDNVITIGGIWGTVANVKEKSVTVKVDANTKLEFNREAISEVIDRKKGSEEATKSGDESGKEDSSDKEE